MRAIDADDLPVHKAYCVDEAGFGATFYVVDKEDIDKAPTIDAMPVVRCGECKHCGTVPYSKVMYCENPMGRNGCVPTKGDAFCSYGERRSE